MAADIFHYFPDGTVYIIFGCLAILLILFYLYRVSEFFSLQKYKHSSTVVLTISFLAILSLFYFQDKPSDKIRIAIFPFDFSQNNYSHQQIAVLLDEQIAQGIPQNATTGYYFYELDQIRKIINLDSLADSQYLTRFAKKMKINYFLCGVLRDSLENYRIQYKIFSVGDGLIFSDCHTFKDIDKLSGIGLIIASKFSKSIHIEHEQIVDYFANVKIQSLKYYSQAKICYFNEKPDSVNLLLNKAVNEDSGNVSAWMLLGDCYLKDGRRAKTKGEKANYFFDNALECFEIAQKLDSLNDKIYQKMAEYFIFAEKWGLAAQKLYQAHRLNPYNPAVYYYFSQLHSSRYQALGFTNEVEILEHALFLNPGFLSAALALSNYYTDYLQDHRLAIENIQRILTINPNQIQALMELGKLYIASSQTLKVMDIFERVIALDPENSNAYYNLGIYYFNQKDNENALKLFKRAISLDQHLDAHLYAAFIYEEMSISAPDTTLKKKYLNLAIENLRYRLRNKCGKDDLYAKTARARLYAIFH